MIVCNCGINGLNHSTVSWFIPYINTKLYDSLFSSIPSAGTDGRQGDGLRELLHAALHHHEPPCAPQSEGGLLLLQRAHSHPSAGPHVRRAHPRQIGEVLVCLEFTKIKFLRIYIYIYIYLFLYFIYMYIYIFTQRVVFVRLHYCSVDTSFSKCKNKIILIHTLLFFHAIICHTVTHWIGIHLPPCTRSGVSNIRPAGWNRPARGSNPAPG